MDEAFESYMRDQYQWDEQFDMELQYSQLDMEASFAAGAKYGAEMQREKDKEAAMECARTVPKSIGQQHGRHHSAGCQRVAAAIEKQEGV